MRIPRFFVELPLREGDVVRLPEEVARHALRVLRMRPGDAVVLFDGRGGEYDGRLCETKKGEASVDVGAHRTVNREPSLRTTLVQGLSSGEKMDFTLQKAVELGISHIQPVATARSVVRLDAERAVKRVRHWQSVVVGACEQSGRDRVPMVAPVLSFTDWLSRPPGPGLHLLFSPHATQRFSDLPPSLEITLLAGPEGGFSDEEVQLAERRGFQAVRLGPRILRTETAALAALAAIQTLWGDL